jgi:hypothetical protein
MAKCSYCGSTIIVGGVRSGEERFCNNKCASNGYVLKAAEQVPSEVIERQVEEVFRGNCPKCRGTGPVDVHKVHRVWSALVLTRWTTFSQVCCRSCATKSQAGGALFSAVFGWWGFPWGLVLTPVQVSRNILGMCAGPDSSRPSDDLRRLVLVNLGARSIQQSRQKTPQPLPAKAA